MHRLLLALATVAALLIASPALAQNPAANADTKTADQSAGAADNQVAPPPSGEAPPAGEAAAPVAASDPPAPSCAGMIPEAELKDACTAALQQDDNWRRQLGSQIGKRILDSLKTAEEASDPAAAPDDQAEQARPKIDPWILALTTEVERRIHDREYNAIQRNNRHVIMAYAALWAAMMLFVAFMWTRQKALKDEIAQLQSELAQATAEDAD